MSLATLVVGLLVTCEPMTPLGPIARRADAWTWDLGDVPHGGFHQRIVTIESDPKRRTRLIAWRSSCACIAVRPDNEVAEPGQPLRIIIEVDASRFEGERSGTLHLTFDEPAPEEWMSPVRANSRVDFRVVPPRVSFGDVPTEKSAQSTVLVRLPSDPKIILQSAAIEAPFAATIGEVEGTGPDRVQRVRIGVSPTDLAGSSIAELRLTTSDPGMPALAIPVDIHRTAPVEAIPNQLHWPASFVGERKLLVRGLIAFQIEGLRLDPPIEGIRIAAPDSTTNRRVHEIRITIATGPPARSRLLIRTTLEASERPVADLRRLE